MLYFIRIYIIYTNTEGVEDGGHGRVIQVMNRSLWVFHNILQNCATNEERAQRETNGVGREKKEKKKALGEYKCSTAP